MSAPRAHPSLPCDACCVLCARCSAVARLARLDAGSSSSSSLSRHLPGVCGGDCGGSAATAAASGVCSRDEDGEAGGGVRSGAGAAAGGVWGDAAVELAARTTESDMVARKLRAVSAPLSKSPMLERRSSPDTPIPLHPSPSMRAFSDTSLETHLGLHQAPARRACAHAPTRSSFSGSPRARERAGEGGGCTAVSVNACERGGHLERRLPGDFGEGGGCATTAGGAARRSCW